MTKHVAPKTWSLPVVNGRRYSAGPTVATQWPLHSPPYLSVLPGIAGPGMDTPGGTGRHLSTPATTVIFVNSLADANTGGPVTGMGADVYAGTFEWAMRHTASPKVIVPLVAGWAALRKSVPLQTGTPPRPGYVTFAGQFAPTPGLFLRGCKVQLNGASNTVIMHLRSYMGDDSTGLSVGARDCIGSGYEGGVTERIALINCEFAWSCSELADFYRPHSQVSMIHCAFVNPLHKTVFRPTQDHGSAAVIGGDPGGQPHDIATFRCLWANSTDHNPLSNADTFVHANNLHFNHGRPEGGAGLGVRISGVNATLTMQANALWNGFVRGPENNATIVAVTPTSTLPSASQGYLEGNSIYGWSASDQAGLLSGGPTGYQASIRLPAAYPSAWGPSGVLVWSAGSPQPSVQEWEQFVDLMDASVGAQPGWRLSLFGRVSSVFQSIRQTLAGTPLAGQFADTVDDDGGWFEVPEVGPLDPLDPGSQWWAPLPVANRDDVLDGTATWGDEAWIPEPFRDTGVQLAGRTVLERWIIKQHWYVQDPSTRPPLPGDNVGEVGSYSDLNMQVHPIYSVDMGEEDYQVFYYGLPGPMPPGAGSFTHHPSGWWDGRAFCRMFPPTEDQLALGIALFDLWRSSAVVMQDFNLRFEWRAGPGIGSHWQGSKFCILHSRRQLDGMDGANDRPILMAALVDDMDNVSIRRPDTLSWAPSQGTVQGWGPGPYGDTRQPAGNLEYWPWSRQPFYLTDAGDTGTHLDSPLIPGGEIITVEIRCVTVPFVDPVVGSRPRGLIAHRVYRRNGEICESGIPWDWDENVPLGAYINEVQMLGCGQYNVAPAAHPDLWMDVGGMVTVARNVGGWLGPRLGFVEED